jgi:DNA-binding PadR family transcriptional regulator
LTEAVYYILLSLVEPMHGYAIMQNVAGLSGGRVVLAAGTLYGALSSLQEKGWIQASPGDAPAGKKDERRKAYRLTESGHKAAVMELERLKELAHNGTKVLGGMDHAARSV